MGRVEIVDESGCNSIYDFYWEGLKEWLKKNLPDVKGNMSDIKTEAIEQYGSDHDVISQFLEEVVEPTLPNNEGFMVIYNDRDSDFTIYHIRVGKDKNKPKKKR